MLRADWRGEAPAESVTDQSEELLPGATMAGRYTIERLLGKGGMGAVYEARHAQLGRTVAIKVLLPALAQDAEAVARFVREARAAASIGHPGIVEVFDLGTSEGTAFLAMEKLEGEELFERIQRAHPLPIDWICRVGADVCDAIAAAHAAGIVHRDLKPQNVFLAHRGRERDVVKVLDFGIAKLTEGDRGDAPLTRTGQVFGTPLYMPPEQLHGAKDLDGRADVYAIGSMLYEMVTGRPPFTAETFAELVLKVATAEPRAIEQLRPDAPAALVSLISRAMAKDRDARVESARELCSQLESMIGADDGFSMAATLEPGQVAVSDCSLPSAAETAPTETPFASEPAHAMPQLPVPARPVRPIRPMLLALAVVLVGGGVTAVLSSGSSVSEATVATRPGPREGATGLVPPPPGDASTATPHAQEVEAGRRVHLFTVPPGAQLSVGDERLCTAPCEVDIDQSWTEISADLPGYQSRRTAIPSPLPLEMHIELERTVRRGSRGSHALPLPPPLKNR